MQPIRGKGRTEVLSNDDLRDIVTSALEVPGLPEKLDNKMKLEDWAWVTIYTHMMPITDWLVSGIIPLIRVDFINSFGEKILQDYPPIESETFKRGTLYKNGAGRTSFVNNSFPPHHVMEARYKALGNKSSDIISSFITKEKSGYSTTVCVGESHFLTRYTDDQFSGRTSDSAIRAQIFRLVKPNHYVLRKRATVEGMVKVLGEDFFDTKASYHKQFRLARKFSEYVKKATGLEIEVIVKQLIMELGLSQNTIDYIVETEFEYETEEAMIDAAIASYVKWLDNNVVSFDLTSPSVLANDMQSMITNNGDSVEVTSLSDVRLRSCVLPDSVISSLGSNSAYGNQIDYDYNVRDFFINCVMGARNVVFNLKANLSKISAQYMTQSEEVDEYLLAQLINKAQTELVDFETYNTNPRYRTAIGDHSAFLAARPSAEATVEQVSAKPTPARIGVNKLGLGLRVDGSIFYIPPKLNKLKTHKAEVMQYFDSLTPSSGKQIIALRDAWDVPATNRVFGSEMSERPRPKSLATLEPLYVDWNLAVVLGTDSNGNISPLLDLGHTTPLTDNSISNYLNAGIYPIELDTNFISKHATAITRVLSKTKPNQWNAITHPLEIVVKNFMHKAVDRDDLYKQFIQQTQEIFGVGVLADNTNLVDALDGTIKMLGRSVGQTTTSGLGSLLARTSTLYYQALTILVSSYGEEENIPEVFNDIIDMGTNGEGEYLTLKSLTLGMKSPSLFVRLYTFILNQIWESVEGKFELFTKVTSFEMSIKYYGTLFAVVDLIKNPRTIMSVAYNTDSLATGDAQPNPLAGVQEGYAMLPHQVRADHHMDKMPEHGIEYTILSAQAGAGKTHLIINDVIRKLEKGLIKRPLVICPGYLEKNYIEDGAYIYEGRLNVIPLDTGVKNYSPMYGNSEALGLEGMLDMINNAPINTLFVASYDFLGKATAYEVPLGTEALYVNPNLEMMLTAGFDYVAADESQFLRNEGTRMGEASMALFYRATYRVLATGTFINTSPSDIPAQTAMLDPTIFGTHSDFKEYYADDEDVSGTKVSKLRESRKSELVESLKSRTGYIQVKRKEWASLLPSRRDSYHRMVLDEDSIQWKIYQMVLRQVLDEIEKALKQNKQVARDAEDEENDEAQQDLMKLLQPYLARLEMLLITPALDEDYSKLLKELQATEDMSDYVSPAIERCITIIRAHLNGVDLSNPPDGMTKEEAFEEYKSFMGLDDEVDLRKLKFIEPIPGKILVFCNYNTSVDAIYNALPPDLKSMAIRYDSNRKDKDIFEFKNNPNKRILIGIQTSLSTGHNLQFCTRLIRVEQVWSPGEVEQGESRINRPDPKNKGAQRSRIYYDWILIDGTIQVTKMSRLVSRMIVNNQIEEHGNDLYDAVDYLPLLKMNLSTIINNCWFVSPSEQAGGESVRSLMTYLKTKNQIDNIQQLDYARWLEFYDGPTKPVEVESAPPLKGSAVVTNIPPIPGQIIANANKFNVVNVAQYCNMQNSQDIDLSGLRCLTPEGDGVITDTKLKNTLEVEINNVKFRFDRLAVSIYLDPNVSRKDLLEATGLKKFQTISGTKVDLKSLNSGITKKTSTTPLVDEEELDEIVEQMAKDSAKKQKALKNDLEDVYKNAVKVLKTSKKKSPIPEPTDLGEPDELIDITATNLNGKLGILLSAEDADLQAPSARRRLTRLGYTEEPDNWYVHIRNFKMLDTLMDKWDAKFNIPTETWNTLVDLLDTFTVGRNKRFNADKATEQEIKEYWLQDRKISRSKDLKLLNPIPCIQDGELYIILHKDLPASKVAKRMKVDNVTWEESGGYWIKMYSDKDSCISDMNILHKYFKFVDPETLKRDIRNIKIVKTKVKTKR